MSRWLRKAIESAEATAREHLVDAIEQTSPSPSSKPCPPVPKLPNVPKMRGEDNFGTFDIFGTAPLVSAEGMKQGYDGPFAAELTALLAANPTPDQRRWHQACDDAEQFLRQWGKEAERLGWTAPDLFALHAEAPLARYDAMGLVWLLRGRAVVEMGLRRAKLSGGLAVTPPR